MLCGMDKIVLSLQRCRAAAVAQVMIDSQGLMKVMHMITVHAAGDGMQRGPTQGATQVTTEARMQPCRAQS